MSTPPPFAGRASPLRLGRFERRILAVIAAVAFIPLIGALVLGRGVLAESYRVGVNPRVRRQLEASLDAYHDHLVHLRADAERTADAVAFDHRLVRALHDGDRDGARAELDRALERYPHLVGARVEDDAGSVLAERTRTIDPDAYRQIALDRTIDDPPGAPRYRVRVTIAAPVEPFRAYQRAGEVVEVYRHLEASTSYVSGFYLAVYIALLLSVAVVALAIGIVVSRRVTRRIVVLADATQKVGGGDLSVEVPTDEADEVGELTRAFNAMVRDIRSSRDRIEYLQRVGAWQEVAKRLAHEIKNPLTPIQLAVQQLDRSYSGDDPKFRRTLGDVRDIVEEEVTTLRRLVKEFSEFARLPEPSLEPADLRSFARDAARGLDPTALASERGAPAPGLAIPELRLEIDDRDELPVKIDAQMLRGCLDNLVRNAVQATVGSRERSGPGGHVIVAARRDGDQALLEVRDDGPGVPADARERVFDPYYTTREEGTGLGLAIVKKIVLEHGGTIACGESREGGAAFRIHLPLAAIEGAVRRRSAPRGKHG
ncbi:MAG: ATP-binding protein [Myxococcota bacterium]|nr:ATP-binding protein [Myxococcota bacterium]